MAYAETRLKILKALPKGGTGAEIGVWKGDFSAQILAEAAPRHLHLIDPWQATDAADHAEAWYSTARGVDMDGVFASVSARFAAEISQARVTLHRATSVEAMTSLPDHSLDFVYVDGDHAYSAVRKDLDLAFDKTRAGGFICIDDHMIGKWWGDGVVRATNEFLGAHPQALEIVFMADTQVVVRKRV